MNILVQILLTKLIEALVKYAERKYIGSKSGETKKAYVLNKLDEVFDVNEDGIQEIKSEMVEFAGEKIEDVVRKIAKK